MRHLLRIVPAIVLALAATTASAQLVQKPALTLEAARQVVAAAEQEARANSWNVVIAVVDEGGHPILLQRMDDTQTASVKIALQKARSAAAFRRPTKDIADWVAGGNQAMLVLPGAIPIAGGRPLLADGRVIGAVGVSGVTSHQDDVIAGAGVAALPRDSP